MARTPTLLPEVKKHYGDLKNYVGGEWRDVKGSEWLEDTNPATGLPIARVPLSSPEDVDVAVQAASAAWETWRETPPQDRARYFFTLRDLMESQLEDLARVVVQDMGKTIEEARGEVRRAIENVEVAAG
ncbi:MAG TPA: aldehyde dehydrogenase family protein, partial [Thermoplasmata archaeon]|nr:aldehyde dehydrogenase family protein [Thermoplasmata archaeon]